MNVIQINGPNIFMILLNMKHLQWSWRAAVGSTSGIFRPTQVFSDSLPKLIWWVLEADGGNGSWWCSPQIRGGWTLGSLALWNLGELRWRSSGNGHGKKMWIKIATLTCKVHLKSYQGLLETNRHVGCELFLFLFFKLFSFGIQNVYMCGNMFIMFLGICYNFIHHIVISLSCMQVGYTLHM